MLAGRVRADAASVSLVVDHWWDRVLHLRTLLEVGRPRSWPPPRTTATQLPTSSMAPGVSTEGKQVTVLPTTTGLARAIADSNILALVHTPSYLTVLNAQLRTGVPRNARDALDLAGNLPLALKANAIGIPPYELNIDPAQAQGLLGKFDSIISGSGVVPGPADVGGVEIKGACSCRGSSSCRGCGRACPSSTSSWWCAVGTLLTGQTWSSSTTSSGWDTCRAPPSTGRWRIASVEVPPTRSRPT
jgi:hypothetical protein